MATRHCARTPAGSSPSSSLPGPVGRFTAEDSDRTPLPGLPAALPCPFCGRTDDIMISESAESSAEDPWYRASCGICGVDAPGQYTLSEAAQEWNKRPAGSAPGQARSPVEPGSPGAAQWERCVTSAPVPGKLPTPICAAIKDQQDRLWRLRSLLDCAADGAQHGSGVEDLEASLKGLVDYADSIHAALDPAALIEAGREIEENEGADGGDHEQ